MTHGHQTFIISTEKVICLGKIFCNMASNPKFQYYIADFINTKEIEIISYKWLMVDSADIGTQATVSILPF